MSCDCNTPIDGCEYGFTRFTDARIVYQFPAGWNFGDWTGRMQVRDQPGGALLFDIQSSVNGSSLAPYGDQIVLVLAKEDLQTLPGGSPWEGYYDIHLIDPDGFEAFFLGGQFILPEGVTQ